MSLSVSIVCNSMHCKVNCFGRLLAWAYVCDVLRAIQSQCEKYRHSSSSSSSLFSSISVQVILCFPLYFDVYILLMKIIHPYRGIHPPLRQVCISPCFRFLPYFPKLFRLRGKFSQFHLFPKKLSIFICQNF